MELFCRGLYLFLFLKILASWPLISTVLSYASVNVSGWGNLLFAPLHVLKLSAPIFMIASLLITGMAVFMRLNYILASIIFWISISLSKLLIPVLNGSDLVLNLFLLMAILIPAFPKLNGRQAPDYQKFISAFCVLLVKLEIALIYFLSGYDKLITPSWRTGASVFSVSNLDFFSNPVFSVTLSNGSAVFIAWLIIVFELAFPVLVWLPTLRKKILLIGILFHLVIIVFLGLLDFGLLMIISYAIFMPVGEKRNSDFSLFKTESVTG